MARKIISVIALIAFALLLVAGTSPASACTPGVNCGQPTVVGKGQKVPIWEVLYCIIGPASGDYEVVDCQDPRAVHPTPTGNDGVCFIGSDNKPHWDYQNEVRVGRKFINKIKPRGWVVDWQGSRL